MPGSSPFWTNKGQPKRLLFRLVARAIGSRKENKWLDQFGKTFDNFRLQHPGTVPCAKAHATPFAPIPKRGESETTRRFTAPTPVETYGKRGV